MRIRQARDEAGRLQSVEQSGNRDGRNVETVSKGDLIEAYVTERIAAEMGVA